MPHLEKEPAWELSWATLSEREMGPATATDWVLCRHAPCVAEEKHQHKVEN